MKRNSFALIVTLLCGSTFATRLNFTSEKKIAQKNLHYLLSLIEKHDFLEVLKKDIIDLDSQIDFKVIEYVNEARSKQKSILLDLHAINIKIKEKMHFICQQLEVIDQKWLRDLTAKIQTMVVSPKKALYFNREKVSRQEYLRATKAFNKKQYLYSSHLYSRSLIILKKIYQSFEWTLPKFQLSK